jgi:hypothetical protein
VHVIPCVVGRLPENAPHGMGASVFGSIFPAVWSFQLALRSRAGSGRRSPTLHLFREQEAAKLLGIPENVMQVALLPVAYTVGTEFKVSQRPAPETITSFDSWSDWTGRVRFAVPLSSGLSARPARLSRPSSTRAGPWPTPRDWGDARRGLSRHACARRRARAPRGSGVLRVARVPRDASSPDRRLRCPARSACAACMRRTTSCCIGRCARAVELETRATISRRRAAPGGRVPRSCGSTPATPTVRRCAPPGTDRCSAASRSWVGIARSATSPKAPAAIASDAAPRVTREIPLSATAAHVYTECARIWNPIHSDAAVAARAGLPGRHPARDGDACARDRRRRRRSARGRSGARGADRGAVHPR